MIRRFLSIMVVCAFPFAATAQETTQYWVTPGDGLYDDVSNWTNVVPDANDDVVFDHDLDYTVTIPELNRRVIDMYVQQGDLTLDLGGTLYLVFGSINIAENAGAPATLTVTNGIMDGLNAGTGNLRITGGAEFRGNIRPGAPAGSTGTVTVDGTGSFLDGNATYIGENGIGNLTISNGAVADIQSYLALGGRLISPSGTGTGTVDVSGSGSQLHVDISGGSQALKIYGHGTGSALNVSDDGAVTAAVIQLVDELLDTGAAMTVATGGSVRSENVSVGTNALIDVNPGGLFQAWETVLDLYTAEPYRLGTLTNCRGGLVRLNGGRLEFDVYQTDDSCGDAGYSSGAFLMTAGELSANTFIGDLNVQGGLIDPGDDRGSMTVTGDYTQSSTATFRTSVTGTYPGLQFNVLTVSGTATLDGKVEVLLDPSYAVTAGTTFDIVTADTISGQFASIGHACISDTLHWEIVYNLDPVEPDTATLQVAQAPAGTVCSGAVTVAEVDVDPWSAANEVSPDSTNSIVVAIQGSNTATGDAINFDVQQIDQNTLRFGPNGAEIISLEPLYGDYDSDTNQDAAFVFSTPDTGIACDDTDASLTGATYAGELFEGTSSIVTVDCTTNNCHE